MINKISTLISNQFIKHKIISEDTKDIYKYGMEITISSLIGLIIVALVGIIFKALLQAMIFYVIFIVLRSTTGGFHATTYLKCNIMCRFLRYYLVRLLLKFN